METTSTKKTRRAFTAEEDNYILENSRVRLADLATKLNRHISSVGARRKELLERSDQATQQLIRERESAQTGSQNPLSHYSPRELMLELRRRGYEGQLTFRELKVHNIDISKL